MGVRPSASANAAGAGGAVSSTLAMSMVAIDKRIQEHLVNEHEVMIESVGEVLAMTRRINSN
jgi:hypothetical protein